jgi:hypothetical protein
MKIKSWKNFQVRRMQKNGLKQQKTLLGSAGEKIMTYFGLRNKKTKKPLGFNCRSNGDAESCGDVEFSLCVYGEGVWLVDKRDYAEKVLKQDTPWYNTGHDSPSWPDNFQPEDWEIFSVEI